MFVEKSLYDCYSNPSKEKMTIYAYCQKIAIKLQSIEYGIQSYNKFVFTFYFITKDGIYHLIKPSNFYEYKRKYLY